MEKLYKYSLVVFVSIILFAIACKKDINTLGIQHIDVQISDTTLLAVNTLKFYLFMKLYMLILN